MLEPIEMQRNTNEEWPDDVPAGTFDWDVWGENQEERRLQFRCPLGRVCAVYVKSARVDSLKTWAWDGNEDRPTLSPSINCQGPSGCGWHGYITNGVMK